LKTCEELEALRSGKLGLLSYLDSVCSLIEKEDPVIHALVPGTYGRKRIISDAGRLLHDFPKQENRPALFGLPLGVKDIIRVKGFPTRCGSKLPQHLFEGAEASCVTRLKQAGALVMGKTVTTEFAGFEPGPTRNPYNPGHTPGGSSSGSAAGVSRGFFQLALGTQTAASVIRPAAYCGVVGFKPSFGRIALDGILPFSPSADHVGFFCKDTSLLPIVSTVLIHDWEDRDNLPDLEKVKAGIPEGPYLSQATENTINFLNRAAAIMEEKGISIVRFEALSNIEKINDFHMRMISGEMARVHRKWYSKYRDLYSPKTVEVIEKGLRVDNEELQKLVSGRESVRDQIDREMNEHEIRFWLTPSATDHAPEGLESTGSPIMSLPWTYAGMPAISIPCGFDKAGLPHGLQIVGKFGEDELLVQFAQELSDMITG